MIDVNLDLEDIGFCFNFSQWSADVENDLYEMPHAETQNPIKPPYFLASRQAKALMEFPKNMRKFSLPSLSFQFSSKGLLLLLVMGLVQNSLGLGLTLTFDLGCGSDFRV